VTKIAVVGAGVSGLAAAAALGDSAEVTVIDRLPVAGGNTGWKSSLVSRLVAECGSSRVRFRLGATALRWSDGGLFVAGPDGIGTVPYDHLVYAGGWRPATAAELGLAGARPAGVITGLVAKHLLEADVLLGRAPLVLGDTFWARVIGDHFHRLGVVVTGLTRASDTAQPEWADKWWAGWEPVSVAGSSRVRSVVVHRGDASSTIPCDSLVLADRPTRLRNVDGAIVDADDTTFVQPDFDQPAELRIEAVRQAAEQLHGWWRS
jgi:hypothetical protein